MTFIVKKKHKYITYDSILQRFTKSMKYLSEVIVPKLLYTTAGICITSALLYLLILSLSMEEPSPTWLIAIIGKEFVFLTFHVCACLGISVGRH